MDQRWFDGSQIGLAPDWKEGIRSMVQHGVAHYRDGRCEGIRFECFNKEEADYVHDLMRHNPGIPYETTRAV